MRRKLEKLWLFSAVLTASLSCSALALESVDTIEGDHYEGVKVLKVEDDGVTLKHSKGIAKVPFYELDEETRRALGHTGEVLPPIRHKERPQSALIPDLTSEDGESLNLDSAEASIEESTELQESRTPVNVRIADQQSQTPRTQTKIVKQVIVQQQPSRPRVKVSAIRASYGSLARAHVCGSSCADARHLGCRVITTKYTPYGNFSYCGYPKPYYGYHGIVAPWVGHITPLPPHNRCRFERVDWRRWNGRRLIQPYSLF